MKEATIQFVRRIPHAERVIAAVREAAAAEPEAAESAPSQLGAVSLVSALGLLLVALAYTGGRAELAESPAMYWLGLGVMVTPVVIRLLRRDVGRGERAGLVAVLALLLYATKVLYAPTEFQFADEFAHWRSTANALGGDRVFSGSNPLLPVSFFYPGLHSATAALADLAGLPIFPAGLLVIGAARLVFALALYLLYERCSGSPRIASLGACIYMANPNFLFFSSYFIYQSLAVPLAALFLMLIADGLHAGRPRSQGMALLTLICLAAVVITHHVTSIALLIFLAAWALVELAFGRRRTAPAVWAFVSAGAIVAWMVYVATPVLGYLGEPLLEAVVDLGAVFSQDGGVSAAIPVTPNPPHERLMSMGAVAAIALSLPLAVGLVLLRYRRGGLARALAFCAVAYAVAILLRLFAGQGAELAGRSWTFIFLGVAFVLANLYAELYRRLGGWLAPRGAVVALLAGLFFGGASAGSPPYWARLPGPYLPSAFERSVTPEGIAAATWAGEALGPDHVFAGDTTNFDLIASYGGQAPARGVSWIYLDDSLGGAERRDIARKGVEYFIVDRRLASGLPATGIYFEGGEPGARRHTSPLDPALLDKFALEADLNRIYDSGNIAIYDVGAWADED